MYVLFKAMEAQCGPMILLFFLVLLLLLLLVTLSPSSELIALLPSFGSLVHLLPITLTGPKPLSRSLKPLEPFVLDSGIPFSFLLFSLLSFPSFEEAHLFSHLLLIPSRES